MSTRMHEHNNVRTLVLACASLALLGCGPGPLWKPLPGPKRFHLHDQKQHGPAQYGLAQSDRLPD